MSANSRLWAFQSGKSGPESGKLPGAASVSNICTSWSGCAYGSGASMSASTRLKMAVLAPIPSASTSTARIVNPGVRRSMRKAKRRSCPISPIRIYRICDSRLHRILHCTCKSSTGLSRTPSGPRSATPVTTIVVGWSGRVSACPGCPIRNPKSCRNSSSKAASSLFAMQLPGGSSATRLTLGSTSDPNSMRYAEPAKLYSRSCACTRTTPAGCCSCRSSSMVVNRAVLLWVTAPPFRLGHPAVSPRLCRSHQVVPTAAAITTSSSTHSPAREPLRLDRRAILPPDLLAALHLDPLDHQRHKVVHGHAFFPVGVAERRQAKLRFRLDQQLGNVNPVQVHVLGKQGVGRELGLFHRHLFGDQMQYLPCDLGLGLADLRRRGRGGRARLRHPFGRLFPVLRRSSRSCFRSALGRLRRVFRCGGRGFGHSLP